MEYLRITQPVPNDAPETIARWLFSQIGEMLQRTEWISRLTEEGAKLGAFDKPVWTRDQRRLAKKLRSFYAHDVQRIDHHGTVHFYNKGRKKGPKNTKKTLHQITEDWATIYHLVHETLVCYAETTLECKTCGNTSNGTNLPDCGHCVAPPRSNSREPVVIKPEGANLQINVEFGRADTVFDRIEMGDNVIPEEQKPRTLRESWPIPQI